MDNKKITVLALIKAKKGQEQELKKLAFALVSPTRKEIGCISYDLHQNAADAASFMFYENWADKKALDDHIKTPHLQAFLAKSAELLAEPLSITIWNKLS